ncbi:MAG: stage III sporulation protein AE [Ruminococcus sp.]|nr:stage III sporulation protein AE [Ruminococcus sp.]
MRVLKIVLCVFLIAFLVPTLSADADDIDEYLSDTDKTLTEVLPDDAQDLMSENNISFDSPENVEKLSATYWLELIRDTVLQNIKNPLTLMGEMLIVIIILTMTKSLLEDNGDMDSILAVIASLASVGILYPSISRCLNIVTETITAATVFMYSYVPVFSSILAAGGSTSSGISYYVTILSVCEIIGFFIENLLVPFMSFTIAVSVVEAIDPALMGINLSGSLKTISKWILGLISSIFIGVISIQGIIGQASDALGTRAIKFAASSFIPVVGGAVSDAYQTVVSSMSYIKSGVGIVGIIAIIFSVLTPVVTVVILKAVLSITKGISTFFGQQNISCLLGGINSVLSIILGILACFTLIFIVATAVMMMLSMNVV